MRRLLPLLPILFLCVACGRTYPGGGDRPTAEELSSPEVTVLTPSSPTPTSEEVSAAVYGALEAKARSLTSLPYAHPLATVTCDIVPLEEGAAVPCSLSGPGSDRGELSVEVASMEGNSYSLSVNDPAYWQYLMDKLG